MALTNTIPSLAATNSATAGLRDIKPPIDIPSPWRFVWWALAVLVIFTIIFFLWRWWQKRRAQIPVVPVIPPHVRARQRLQEALTLIGQPKEFCVTVSDIVRSYLEERFTFHAHDRTTEEFLHELAGTELLTRDQKESLGEFLTQCDLVKFAKYEPGEPELRALHASALRLVEETEPLTVVTSGTAAQTSSPS